MAENNVVDIQTGKPLESKNIGDLSTDVQDELLRNQVKFNEVGVLEATFKLLKKSEHFSDLIQDLQYTRQSKEKPQTQIAANDDIYKIEKTG